MRKVKNFRGFLQAALIVAINLAAFSTTISAQENVSLTEPEKQTQKQTEAQPSDAKSKTPIAETEKISEGDWTIEINQPTRTDRQVETTLARNFSRSTSFKTPKFRDFSFTSKDANAALVPEATRQTSDKDDTMMGVMGKGTDSLKIGGHVGFVVPIVGRGNGVTTNLGDRFVFGFPVGLTLKTRKNIAIDFEFIPTFNTGRDFVLTIHPGIIYGFAKKYAVGVRAAYDAGAGSFGFTPLISRGFKINDKVGFFVEADFPIRSNYNPYRDRFGSIAFAAHAGFAF